MIIVFEGLSCAGKSTILSSLLQKYPENYRVIPEFIIDTTLGVTTEVCMANDIAKTTLAKLIDRKDLLVLVDRSHISTLAYMYGENEERFAELQAWYAGKDLSLPNKYVYLRITPELAIDRAKKIGRYTSKYSWYTHTEKIFKKYEEIIKEIAVKVPVLTIDANVNLTELADDLHSKLNQFLNE